MENHNFKGGTTPFQLQRGEYMEMLKVENLKLWKLGLKRYGFWKIRPQTLGFVEIRPQTLGFLEN